MSTRRRQRSDRWLMGKRQHPLTLPAMPGRLELSWLPEPLRSYAVVMTVVMLVACALVLLHAFGVYPFDQTVVVPASSSPTGSALTVPPSLAVLTLAGLGLASGVLMLTSRRPGWRPASGRLFIAIAGAATVLPFLSYSWGLRSLWNGVDAIQAALQLQFVCVALAGAAAGAAIPCSLFSKPKPIALAARLTTLSYLALSAAFVALTVVWLLLGHRSNLSDQVIAVFQFPVSKLVGTLTPALWLIGIVFFW